MADALVRSESPAEYFKELVESAMVHQHVAVRDLTSFYLVNLLTGFVHSERSAAAMHEPLGMRLATALQAGGSRQRDGLREVGDLSLFITGFFADSLNRSLVDVDYYMQLGEYAYGSLAQRRDAALSAVFGELAGKFSVCADVLGEVSERTGLTSNADLLRLYEKWLRTRSKRSRELLAERGIVAVPIPHSRLVQ